jgi:hypothetical protein
MATMQDKQRALRERWVELEPGKRVRYHRPRTAEVPEVAKAGDIGVAVKLVDGWEGFTEADLLGPSIGANEPVPFHPEVWAEYALDRMHVIAKVLEHIVETMKLHDEQQRAVEKN